MSMSTLTRRITPITVSGSSSSHLYVGVWCVILFAIAILCVVVVDSVVRGA